MCCCRRIRQEKETVKYVACNVRFTIVFSSSSFFFILARSFILNVCSIAYRQLSELLIWLAISFISATQYKISFCVSMIISIFFFFFARYIYYMYSKRVNVNRKIFSVFSVSTEILFRCYLYLNTDLFIEYFAVCCCQLKNGKCKLRQKGQWKEWMSWQRFSDVRKRAIHNTANASNNLKIRNDHCNSQQHRHQQKKTLSANTIESKPRYTHTHTQTNHMKNSLWTFSISSYW